MTPSPPHSINDRPTFLIGLCLLGALCWGVARYTAFTSPPRLSVLGVHVPAEAGTVVISNASEARYRLPRLPNGRELRLSRTGNRWLLQGADEVFVFTPRRASELLPPLRITLSSRGGGTELRDGALVRVGRLHFEVWIRERGLDLRYRPASLVGIGFLFPSLRQFATAHGLLSVTIPPSGPTRFNDGTPRWDMPQLAEKQFFWPGSATARGLTLEPQSSGHFLARLDGDRRQSIERVLEANRDFRVATMILRIERNEPDTTRLALQIWFVFGFFLALYLFGAKRQLGIAGRVPLLDVAFFIVSALNLLGLALLFRLAIDPRYLDNLRYFQNKLGATMLGYVGFFVVVAWPRVREMLRVVALSALAYGALVWVDTRFAAPDPLLTLCLSGGAAIWAISVKEFDQLPGRELWHRIRRKAHLPAAIFFALGLIGLLTVPLGIVRAYKLSEFSKIFFILYFSLFFSTLYSYFDDRFPRPIRSGPELSLWRQWLGFTLPLTVLLVLPLALTFVFYFLANDFGPFLIFALVFATFVCFAMPKYNLRFTRGLTIYNLPVLLVVAAAAIGMVYHRELLEAARNLFAELGSSKVTQRIDSFFQPWRYSAGEHIAEALWYATRSQAETRYIPNMHSDLVFAELLRGGMSVVLTYVAANVLLVGILLGYGRSLFLRHQGTRTPGVGPAFVVILAAHYWVAQHFVNIGATVGFSLMTGLTLPFLSYGGTSTLSWFFLFGVVYRQWRHLEPSTVVVPAPIVVHRPLLLPPNEKTALAAQRQEG